MLVITCFSVFKSDAQATIQVFDTLLYYDGYAGTVNYPVPAGIIRHRNDLYARKLTDSELQSIGTQLTMNISIKASCDNYDRIGDVNLAFVPKGSSTYTPDSVQRIEIARYITPFMDKNKSPNTVPYTYSISNVANILKDSAINSMYDLWVELQLFGVPYSANTQIAGCSGRNDVFYGSLQFITDAAVLQQNNNVLLPGCFQFYLNNYQAKATDTLGKTVKTVNFNVPENLTDAAFFLITSNHGANSGGEEYNRRLHYIYLDNTLEQTYKPGSLTCEPFRVYNTQANGIYQTGTQSNAYWQSFSNWCPGDVIPIRRVNLGAVSAGNHSFMIRVPDAVFTGAQGYFPVSVYLQGKTSGMLDIEDVNNNIPVTYLYPNPVNNILTIESDQRIDRMDVYNLFGQKIIGEAIKSNEGKVDVSALPAGVYFVQVQSGMKKNIQKFIKE